MRLWRWVSGAILGAALLMLAPAVPHAVAAGLFEKQIYMTGPRYDGLLPACEQGLGIITSRFAEKESRFWNSDLQILGYEHVRETAYRPWTADSIPRRYCAARALVSDGRRHTVYYSIGEDTGFLGAGWGVDFCVVGLDRNLAYNPGCKMARP